MNWDLTSFFPAFGGPEMQGFKEALQQDLATLQKRAADLAPLGPDNAGPWEALVLRSEELLARLDHLGAYVGCLASVDARAEAYAREEAAMAVLGAELDKLEVELKRGFKEAAGQVFAAFVDRPALAGCGYFLGRLRQEARQSMAVAEEQLAADLGVDGLQAWGRLYDTLSGKLEFDMEFPDGRRERLPMSQRRSLMAHPDRQVRRAAFAGGTAAWQQVEGVAAAALNAIAGTRLTLNRHRGIAHFLDVPLFQAAITGRTLAAMWEAISCRAELPRRVLRLKARAMQTPGVAWYDLEAPLPLPEQEPLSWEEGRDLVERAFRQAYPRLGEFFAGMCRDRWIEWELRPGKRPGAFCTGSLLNRESRIFMTYARTLGDVRTLAHEAGHAFHSAVMQDLRPYARLYPMTLAEAASTFGEMLLTQGVLAEPGISERQKARILDMEVAHAAVYLLDIPVRYEFEKVLYEERASGELSVSRLNELMAQTQRRVFGQVLEEGGEDPYFWAWKLHFYITGVSFYNFPYTFGFLFSRGLFARFAQEGAGFLPRYEEFLRRTGSATAEEVARQILGCDLEDPRFWEEAIGSLEPPLHLLEELLPRVVPGLARGGTP